MSNKNQKSLVPELRFPEFINKSRWESERFDSIYELKVTNSFSRDKLNYENGSVKNIHYGDIHTKFSTLFDLEKEQVPFINSEISLTKIKPDSYCKEGDIVFADASEDIQDIGKSIELTHLHNKKILAGLHTILARPTKNTFTKGFSGYLFKSLPIRKQIQKEAQGAKVLGISSGRISKIEIIFPPSKQEQQKIANCLSSIDELIASETQKLESYKSHKKGLMQQLFPALEKSRPKLRFSGFEGKWKVRQLSEFISERTEIPKEKVPLFSLTIEEGVTPKTERYERSFLVKDHEDAYKLVRHNDFAYNPMNLRFGAIARHHGKDNVAVSKYYNIFKCDKSVDSRFCETYFQSYKMVTLYNDVATGSLIEKRRVHFGEFLKFEIEFPSLPEQQKIADCLTSLDELITAQSLKIETLKIHKKGLMQQLFPAIDEAGT